MTKAAYKRSPAARHGGWQYGAWVLVLMLAVPVTSAQPTDSPDTIHLATVNANYRAAFEAIVARYEELNPHITVKLTIIGQGYETWMRAMFAAGGDMIPDIYNVNYTGGAQQEGKLVFLDRFLDEPNRYTGTPWRECLDMRLVERYKWANQVYMIPLDYVDIAVFYNKAIFAEAGVGVPETWPEFMRTCATLRARGHIPIAMAGNFDSFWVGTVGWLYRLMGDAYFRNMVEIVKSRPGDWDYDETRNKDWVYDPSDPYNDLFVVMNDERKLNALLDDTIDVRGPKFRAMSNRIREIAQHFQKGYMGADEASALQLFYRGKAAMVILTSASVTGIVRDFKRLDPDSRFDYGNFWFPPITDDPLVCSPFRGVGGAGVVFGVYQKHDEQHTRNCVDLLHFLTSPEGGRMLMEKTLEADQPIVGPPLVKGVELPRELQEKFSVFLDHGFEKLHFLGLGDLESSAEYVMASQRFLAGDLDMDAYLEEYRRVLQEGAPRLARRVGYDMDPTTQDAPPADTGERNPLNPFVNGVLALGLIVGAFAAFGIYHLVRVRGAPRRTTATAYLLLLPTFLLLGTFAYFPALSGLYHAFTEWEGTRGAVFNGLENFQTLLGDKLFWAGALNMLLLTAAGVIKSTIPPFIAAELIMALRNGRLRYLFRTAFLLPMVVPIMVTIMMWRFIYDPNVGMLNDFLTSIGLEHWTRSWLGDRSTALASIMCIGFPWVGAVGFLIYLAGLMNVPSNIYEAYRLESQSILKRILHIDVPLVRGQTRLLVVLAFIGSLQDFQAILIITNGGPADATMVPALRMFHTAFKFEHFGYGASLGFVLFLAILCVTIVNMRLLKPAEEL